MRIIVSICAAMLVMTSAAFAAGGSSTQQKLVDLEATWSKAMTQKDTAALSSIVADDWKGQDDSGKTMAKDSYIAMVKSGDMATSSMTNHDVSVRVMGNVAVVQGSDDEKSSMKGKDTSGTYTWMDVFEKRGDKWVAIASQITKVTPTK